MTKFEPFNCVSCGTVFERGIGSTMDNCFNCFDKTPEAKLPLPEGITKECIKCGQSSILYFGAAVPQEKKDEWINSEYVCEKCKS